MPAISRMRSVLVLPLLLAAVLSALIATTSTPADAETATQRIGTAVDVALRQVGDPYHYGAAGPNAFDCSGLVYYSFRRAGFSRIPRTSSAQARWARPIAKRHMRRGDLMYFVNSGGVYHAAIFLRWRHGKAWMLDAPEPGQDVHRHYSWTSSWVGRTLR